ncbi:MAG TPA: helix-turn-helix domain-containing protein [Gemmataceae bacterium]
MAKAHAPRPHRSPEEERLSQSAYTIEDVARLMRVRRGFVRKWIRSERLPWYADRVTGACRIPREGLAAFLKAHAMPSLEDCEASLAKFERLRAEMPPEVREQLPAEFKGLWPEAGEQPT